MAKKVGIIGAGPSGISAAVQLTRYGISTTVFEKRKIGGLVENAYRIDNLMLYPDGISGREFVKILEDYARRYRIDIKKEEVLRVEKNEKFIIHTKEGEYVFSYLIVATGTKPKKLDIPGAKYHITDIEDERRVMIIGGGDIALDYALSASEIGEAIVLHRSELKAIPSLQEEVQKNPRIRLVRGVLHSWNGSRAVTSAGIFDVDVILVAIGRVPNIDIVRHITSDRMFIVGDARNGMYRQSSLAIADGIRAAMKIWRCEKYGDSCRDW